MSKDTPRNGMIVIMWHRWRAKRLALKLKVQNKRCELLEIAAHEYKISYYTDRMHDALCRRIEIASALEYHNGRIK